MILPTDFQRCAFGQQVARLGDSPLTGKDLAGQDQRLPARAAFDQTEVHQALVGALLTQADAW